MRISVYTAMRNCIENDYPFIEMLRHHLPLADEIVINEGYSTDGTFEAISNLDPKIKIFRTNGRSRKARSGGSISRMRRGGNVLATGASTSIQTSSFQSGSSIASGCICRIRRT